METTLTLVPLINGEKLHCWTDKEAKFTMNSAIKEQNLQVNEIQYSYRKNRIS